MHTKHKRIINIVVITIIIVSAIIMYCIRYQYINTKYPNPTLQEHYINQTFTYQGVDMTVSDFTLLEYEDFLTQYNLDPKRMDMYIPGAEQKNVCFKLHVKNTSDTKKEINAGELMLLETDGWVSYTDLMDSFRLLNDGRSSMMTLDPGEEDSLLFSYCLYDLSFSKKDYENLYKSKFEIVLSLYPVKNVVRLN